MIRWLLAGLALLGAVAPQSRATPPEYPAPAQFPSRSYINLGLAPDGAYAALLLDSNHYLQVNCVVGCGGGGGSGGTLTQGNAGSIAQAWYDQIVYNGALVSSGNKFPITSALDALISAGALSVSLSTVPLPAGAATSSLQQSQLTALGSPFQANGSIGNTAFGINYNGAVVSPTNLLGITDVALDALVNSGGTSTGNAEQVTSDQAVSTGNITTQNLNPLSGTPTAGSSVTISVNGQATLGIQFEGTYTGILSLQGTIDGVNWITIAGAYKLFNWANTAVAATIASGTNGIFTLDVTGLSQVRVTALAAVTGTAVISLRPATHEHMVSFDNKNAIIADILGSSGSSLDNSATGGTISTNALTVGCYYNSTPSSLTSGYGAGLGCDSARNLLTSLVPAVTPNTSDGLAWVSSVGSSTVTGKSSGAALLYNASVTMGTTAGYLITYNSLTAQTAGNTLTASLVADCVYAPANVTTSITYNPVPEYFSAGLQLVVSTTCGTYTVPSPTPTFMKANYK